MGSSDFKKTGKNKNEILQCKTKMYIMFLLKTETQIILNFGGIIP